MIEILAAIGVILLGGFIFAILMSAANSRSIRVIVELREEAGCLVNDGTYNVISMEPGYKISKEEIDKRIYYTVEKTLKKN